jgi:predicted MFS family arabinose efflux permease
VSSRATRSALPAAVGGMVALAAAMGIGRFVYTPILPSMADALGLSKSTAGLIASANFLGYLAGALLAAAPRLPGGRGVWVLASLCVVAATTAGMAWGGASALVLERLATLGRRDLVGVHFSGVGLGIALSAASLAALQAAGAGWQSLWVVEGALAALAIPAFAALVGREAGAARAPGASAAAQSGQVSAPGLIWLDVSYGLFGFGYVVTATFLVAATHTAGATPYTGLAAWLVVGLAAAPSTAAWSWLGRRQGPLHAFSIAAVAAAAGVAVGGLWSGVTGALLAALLLGGTFMGLTALGFEAARNLAPWRQRRSFAVMTACFGLGQMAGPLLAGWLMDRTGSFLAPSLLGAAALLLSGLAAQKAGWRSKTVAIA